MTSFPVSLVFLMVYSYFIPGFFSWNSNWKGKLIVMRRIISGLSRQRHWTYSKHIYFIIKNNFFTFLLFWLVSGISKASWENNCLQASYPSPRNCILWLWKPAKFVCFDWFTILKVSPFFLPERLKSLCIDTAKNTHNHLRNWNI